MKRLFSFLLAIGISISLFAQQATVKIVKGMAAIPYKLGEKESSYDVYKRFGMDEATFLLLNQPDDIDSSGIALPEDAIWVAVANNLLMQCSAGCVSLQYEAVENDNFKKIGGYFGNLNPYYIKQWNPLLEAVSVGKLVQVGYLPGSLFAPGSLNVIFETAGKAAADSTASGNANRPVVATQPATPDKSDTAVAKVPYSGAGYFAAEFKSGKAAAQKGKMGNFKSFGGWYDGKFYILINGIETGKVVKVTNTQNGMVVFAKVVSPLPEIKGEKSTLLARINNAACAALDIWDDTEFEVEILY
jgi:hypothetical protein